MALLAPPLHPAENMQARRAVAAQLLGGLEFMENDEAALPCPAAHLHSKQDNRAARLYLRGAPSIFCFHDSCRSELDQLNQQLRREIGRAEKGANMNLRYPFGTAQQTRINRGPLPAELRRQKWAQLGPKILQQALELYPLDPADLWERSPVHLMNDPEQDFTFFMRTLWLPHEIVWVGYNKQSGQEKHAANFKPAAVWGDIGKPCGPQTCAFTFPVGCYSRCKANIITRRHLVLESDTLTHAQAASVFWWVKERMKLPLRAVVHSGSKSLHAWFAVPDAERLRELVEVLPVVGMDGAVLKNESQPVRCPGWKREDGAALFQGLLYLDQKACEL